MAIAGLLKRKRPARGRAVQGNGEGRWDSWIAFAVEQPRLFQLMVESARSDPSTSAESFRLMRNIIVRLGEEGRLKTEVDEAARAIWAASNGVLALCSQNISGQALKSTSELLFEAVVERLTLRSPDP